MKPTRLALAQMPVESGAPERNLRLADEQIAKAARMRADIVLLPEALDCGWTHPSARELAGAIPCGFAYESLRTAAVANGVMVCAGIIERSGDGLFNSAVLIAPNGELLLHHRKIHELDFARALYSRGDRLAVAETEYGRIGVMICADAFVDGLVISRSLGQMGAQLILSPCAWAVPPHYDNGRTPYGQLWRESYGPPAREFGMTIAGCSNIGSVTAGEWSGWRCIGCSLVTGPDGETLAAGRYGEAELLIVELPGGAHGPQ
jgi:predicted amidohydrolase